MKKVMAAVVVTLLAAPLAHAVGNNYVWQASKYDEVDGYSAAGYQGAANWDNALNWNPNKPATVTTGDTVVVGRDADGNPLTTSHLILMPSGSRSFGSLTLDNADFHWNGCNYKFAADNDQSGDFRIGGTARVGYYQAQQVQTWDIDGDYVYDSTNTPAVGGVNVTIILRDYEGDGVIYHGGASQTQDGSAPDKVIIDNGATVAFSAGTVNAIRKLEIWGTASGAIYWYPTMAEDIRLMGSDASQLDVTVGVGEGLDGDNAMLFSGTYQDVSMGSKMYKSASENHNYTFRLPGNLQVRDFSIGSFQAGDPSEGVTYIVDVDNDGMGSKISDLTVTGNLQLGNTNSGYRQAGVLKVRSGNLDVDGDVNIYSTTDAWGVGSWIEATTGQISVAGDWTVHDPAKSGTNWDLGTSTVVFDGTDQAIDAGKGVPFHNVIIDQTASSITLEDNLVLTGNLRFDSASTVTISNETDAFIFKGGQDTFGSAQEIDVKDNDLISMTIAVLNPPSYVSYVKLLSDLTLADNLNIEDGCKLFLNTYTLTLGEDAHDGTGDLVLASGDVSSLGMAWGDDGGLIIGTAPIPEPGTMLLLGTGLIGVVGLIRRRRMK